MVILHLSLTGFELDFYVVFLLIALVKRKFWWSDLYLEMFISEVRLLLNLHSDSLFNAKTAFLLKQDCIYVS
jgi:hypothetical protein